jgi:hypothetical protein
MCCYATGAWPHFNGLDEPAPDANACCQSACHADARHWFIAHCHIRRFGGSQSHVAGQSAVHCNIRLATVHSDRTGYDDVHTIVHADRSSVIHCHPIDRHFHSRPSAERADSNTRSACSNSRAHAASAAHAHPVAYSHPCAHSHARANHPADPGHGVGE